MNLFYVGVDVSLAHLDVAYATPPSLRTLVGRFSNDAAGFAQLAAQVKALAEEQQYTSLHLVLEPSGGYEAALLSFAYAQGWLVTLVNPYRVRQWAAGQGIRAKTDRQDALLLAWYAASQQPAAQDEMDEGAAHLDELLRRRRDLEQLQRAEQNRYAQAQRKPRTPPAVHQSLQRTLRTLDEELQALDAAIKHLLKDHPYLKAQRQLLRSSPAIGEKVSLELVVLCHRFWAYTCGEGRDKQLVALLGLDPQVHESGKSIHRAAISRQGDARLRSLLYCAALGGIRGHNPLRTFYERLVAKGKPKKVALVACARKVLTWAWAIFTSNTPFDATRFAQPDPSLA
jgi:transposase